MEPSSGQPTGADGTEAVVTDNENVQCNPVAQMKKLEAILFLARQPINSRKISQLAGLEDGTQARTMIRELNEKYDRVGQAFHVKRVAGGYQMLTRPRFAPWIRRLDHVPGSQRLSTPALETLTVVAYRQPIIKAEVEAIRGVSCGEMLRQLLEKGLVKMVGRSEVLGRPFLYGTTKNFLVRYGLNNLADLPRAEQLRGDGLPDWTNLSDNSNNEDSTGETAAEDSAVNQVAVTKTVNDESTLLAGIEGSGILSTSFPESESQESES